MYSGIKEAICPPPRKSAPLNALDGTALTETAAQLNRWVEHYSTVYCQPVTANLDSISAAVPQMPPVLELDKEVTINEITKATTMLQNRNLQAQTVCSHSYLSTAAKNFLTTFWHSSTHAGGTG